MMAQQYVFTLTYRIHYQLTKLSTQAATAEFIFQLTLKFTDRGDIMRVYIKTDSKNRITAVNSEIFIKKCKGDSFE